MQYWIINRPEKLKHITVSWIQQGYDLLYLGNTDGVIEYAGTDTVVFDPSREDRFVPWNPIKGDPVALADTFLDIWNEGSQTAGSSHFRAIDHLYLSAALTVLIAHGCNILHLPYFLNDKDYRMSLLPDIKDVFVRDFWFGDLDERAVASISAKASTLLIDPNLRRVFTTHRDNMTARVVLADISLSRTPKRLLSSLLASQTDKFVVVENCADVSENVLLDLVRSDRSIFLSFKYRSDISEELYDAITSKCENVVSKPERFWPVEDIEFDPKQFWKHHDRYFTRSTAKADRDFDALMKRL